MHYFGYEFMLDRQKQKMAFISNNPMVNFILTHYAEYMWSVTYAHAIDT